MPTIPYRYYPNLVGYPAPPRTCQGQGGVAPATNLVGLGGQNNRVGYTYYQMRNACSMCSIYNNSPQYEHDWRWLSVRVVWRNINNVPYVTPTYFRLDPSEKVGASYHVGMMCAFLIANRAGFGQGMLLSRFELNFPNRIDRDPASPDIIFFRSVPPAFQIWEAKGGRRTVPITLDGAIDQSLSVDRVDVGPAGGPAAWVAPNAYIASHTRTHNDGSWRWHVVDPGKPTEEPSVDDGFRDALLYAFYSPFLHFLLDDKDTSNGGSVEFGDRAYQSVWLNRCRIRVGLEKEIFDLCQKVTINTKPDPKTETELTVNPIEGKPGLFADKVEKIIERGFPNPDVKPSKQTGFVNSAGFYTGDDNPPVVGYTGERFRVK